MSREKQIEEMARDICGLNTSEGCFCDGGYCNYNCLSYEKAEALYNAGYRKQEWTGVDERLPETRETILYFNGEWVDACYFSGDNFMTLDTYESDIIDGITHWMPLPPPPKENKNGGEVRGIKKDNPINRYYVHNIFADGDTIVVLAEKQRKKGGAE